MEENLITAACVPMPIQVVIDDVGWWSGEDGHTKQEPYRTGIGRGHVPEDYRAIARLGRALNMRPQAALVLCEWDRENLLRHLPSSTWMGAAWNNPWNGPWLEQTADLLRQSWDYLEPALHGVGHEYWRGGRMERAEWHDAEGKMRPRDEVLRHLDCFERLLQQHRLGPFPESFVPAAFLHRFGEGEEGLAGILRTRGIKYVSTPFARMHPSKPPGWRWFGLDAGVMTVDRGEDICRWNALEPVPEGELPGPVCGMHWPNLLHSDPSRNHRVVDRWIAFLRPIGGRIDRMLARDTRAFCTQLAYHECARMELRGNAVRLDLSKANAMRPAYLDSFVSIRLETHLPVRFEAIGAPIAAVNALPPKEANRYEIVLGDAARATLVQITACRVS